MQKIRKDKGAPFMLAVLVALVGGMSVDVAEGTGYHFLGVGYGVQAADVRREEGQDQSDSGGWFVAAAGFFSRLHEVTTTMWRTGTAGLLGVDAVADMSDTKDAADQSKVIIAKVDDIKKEAGKVSMSGASLYTRMTTVHTQDDTFWMTNMSGSGPDLRQRLVLG